MYRLLIVDDEKQVREGLKRLLPWEEYGIEICGEARNGAEALELIEALLPHIVLMDIQMPVMNGIELAEKIHENYPQCKFIVLSGYDDFALVRQAMKAGAVDYLLKPSGKEAIIQILEEVMDTFEDEIASRLKNDEQMKLMKNNVLGRLVSGTLPAREAGEKLDLLELKLDRGPFTVISAEFQPHQNGDDGEKKDYPVLLETMEIFDRALTAENKGTAFIDPAGNVCMIAQEFSGWKEDGCLKNILLKCIAEVKEKFSRDICVAVGSSVSNFRRLYESCQNARNTLVYKTVFGTGSILYCEEIREYFSALSGNVKINGEEFKQIFQKNEKDRLKEYVGNVLFSGFETQPEKEIYILKNAALEMIILAYQCFDNWISVDRNELYKKKNLAMREIMFQSDVKNIYDTLCSELSEAIEKASRYEKRNYSKVINDAINYIEQFYSKPELSLQYLADEFHTNAAYLGRVFRKETGSSFTDYLNNFRVKKAESLLLSTNYKGIELAEKVGFASYNYFYIVFKKITGKKPMDIRKK